MKAMETDLVQETDPFIQGHNASLTSHGKL